MWWGVRASEFGRRAEVESDGVHMMRLVVSNEEIRRCHVFANEAQNGLP